MKTQIKKSLSLFLAVLMVLSCWVWVAPEKAEAASIDLETEYKVTVEWQLADRKGQYTGGNIKYKTVDNNGWGNQSGEKIAVNSLGDCLTNNKSYSKTFTTTDFPTVVKISYEGGNTDWGAATQDGNKARCELLKVSINDKVVWSGNIGYNGANSQEVYPTYDVGGNFGTTGGSDGTYNWPRPHIVGFVDETASASQINLSLNKIDSGLNSEGSTSYDITKYTCYSQYNVKIDDPADYVNKGRIYPYKSADAHISSTKNSDEQVEDTNIFVKEGTDNVVVAKPGLQVSDPKGSTGEANYFLVKRYVFTDSWDSEIVSKVSAPINIKYPKYDVTFNAGLNAEINGAEKLGTGTYTVSGVHAGNMLVPAVNRTYADGNTFYGYWSKPQPDSSEMYNASFYAEEADFAMPCSDYDYKTYLTASGTEEIEKDKLLKLSDGTMYYNAGEAYDVQTVRSMDCENYIKTWYGWWLADDITVSFYDIDGKYLHSELVKYGQDQKVVTWPESAYDSENPYVSGVITATPVAGQWVHTNGLVVKEGGHTFNQGYDLILTPNTTNKIDKVHTITFMDTDGNKIINLGDKTYTKDYNYRETAIVPPNREVPADVATDIAYNYTFLGWSSIAPTVSGKSYHVLLEDKDFDVNGRAIGLVEDWIVRGDTTYYPVFRRIAKSYDIEFKYINEAGTQVSIVKTIKYGSQIKTPDVVPYTFVANGFGREFENWSYTDAANAKATFAFDRKIEFTKENFKITDAALSGDNSTPIVIQAVYKRPVITSYTITFNSRNTQGDVSTQTVSINHGAYISIAVANSLKPATIYDTEEARFTFTGEWKVVSGADVLGKEYYTTEELTGFAPKSNVVFEAQYGNPVEYHKVTYVDGDKTYEEKVLDKENLPVWLDGGKVYIPSMPDSDEGAYVFQGWYDEEQADETYKVTNGTKYEYEGDAISKVTEDITLYPQFKLEPYTYMIEFLSHDGKDVIYSQLCTYGAPILVGPANAAARTRPSDATYNYEFIGWDKVVPEFCEGKAMTFIAMYKPVYRYYEVKWYNSTAVKDAQNNVTDWVIDESDVIATSRHTYNSKLYTPSATITCPETAPAGKRYVFAGWFYEDGTAYARGTEVKGEMKLYAKYTLTNQPVNVTTVVGENTNTITVAQGTSADVISQPASGYVDATNHNEFAGWYTDASYTTKFTETTITSNITLYAKFTESAHDFTNEEMTKAPTYYAKGEKISWCSCDKEKTKKTEEVDKLTDNVAPTGIIYLGELGSWSSANEPATGTVEGAANPDTRLIITAKDDGIGVKAIRTFAYPANVQLTATSYGAAEEAAYEVFTSDNEDLTNIANYTVKLKDLVVVMVDENGQELRDENNEIMYQPLQSGEEYVVYYYVVDKAGNMLNRSVKTAKFVYDATAPEFKITGNSNAAKNPNIVTYCEKATLTNVEVGATLKINGVETALTSTSIAGRGSYTITEAGNYLITVTDAAGNSVSKKIIVVDEHNYIESDIAATCTTDGSKTKTCLLCGHNAVSETIPATGHTVSIVAETAADCTTNGTVTYACEDCDLAVTTEYAAVWADDLDADKAVMFNETEAVSSKIDGVTKYLTYVFDTEGAKELYAPAKGHTYDKDANDEFIYTVTKAATCYATGEAKVLCSVCKAVNADAEVKEIPVDTSAHVYTGKTRYVSATCTEDGYSYINCKYSAQCGSKKIIGTIPATKHSTQWIVVKEATCGEAGTMKQVCTKCNTTLVAETAYDWVEVADGDYAYVSDDEGIVTKVEEGVTYYQIYRLPKTNRHDYKITSTDATEDKEGDTTYKCRVCGFSKTVEGEKLIKYTVTFKNGTNSESKTANAGTGVTIADPTKAATDKVKYTFVGWADEDGKIVKLPLTMSEDINGKTFTAQYKETPILYTHTFVVPTNYNAGAYTGSEHFKTLVGAAGSEVKVSEEPVFAPEGLSKQYAFEFKGWKRIDATATVSDETEANNETSFIVTGDATFVAEFKAIPNKYQVTFYSSATKYIWSATVDGGATVAYGKVDSEGKPVYPATTFDNDYHYTFNNKWYTDSTLETEFNFTTEIYANTRLYAGYTKSAHTYDESKSVVTQTATCDRPELTKMVCSCGYETTVQTQDALGHAWDEGKTVNGVTTYTCTRDASHTKTDDVQTFTVKFVNYNGLAVQSFYDVVYGQKVDFTVDEPTQAESVAATYKFIGWSDGFTEKIYTTAEIEAIEITENYTFVAEYEAITRIYRVSYVDNNKTLQTGEYKYGAAIPAFAGTAPAKDRDDTHHYVFASWSVSTSATVAGDTVIKPVYTAIAHDYTDAIETDPTCTTKGEKVLKCSGCDAVQVLVSTTPALGHTDVKEDGSKVEHTIIPATTSKEGKDSYICTRCGEVQSKTIPMLKSKTIVITVYDAEGNLAKNGAASVTLKNKLTGEVFDVRNTNEDGQAIFENVPEGQEWSVGIVGDSLPMGGYGGDVAEDGTFTGGQAKEEEDPSENKCSCSCHKNSFWGMLYRFFQNIIAKLFKGGKVNCCDDPDARYFK